MSAVFGVSELARTTVSSTSAAEATKRALALYRTFQKSVRIRPLHVDHARVSMTTHNKQIECVREANMISTGSRNPKVV